MFDYSSCGKDEADSNTNGNSNNYNGNKQTTSQRPGFKPPKTPSICLCFTEEEATKFKIYGDTNYEVKIRSLIYDLAIFPYINIHIHVLCYIEQCLNQLQS